LTAEEAGIGEFFVARGGPFYTLQRQLGLLREDAFRAGLCAMLFVGLDWMVPLILSITAGDAIGRHAFRSYLFDFGMWARLFIAVGPFILMERQVEERLQKHFSPFARPAVSIQGAYYESKFMPFFGPKGVFSHFYVYYFYAHLICITGAGGRAF